MIVLFMTSFFLRKIVPEDSKSRRYSAPADAHTKRVILAATEREHEFPEFGDAFHRIL